MRAVALLGKLNHAIMNRAAELDPNGNIMANKSILAANTDSLKNLQKQSDAVSAFENTAFKNIDRTIAAAQKVPDLGTRFANTPVRMINENMLGTPEMAALRADLLTSQTEVAKILSSATASGVLSDSARQEVQDITNGNLPLPAMIAAFNELKADIGNRHQSYADQISDMQRRIKAGGKGNEQTTSGFTVPQGAPAAPAEDGHKLKQNGNVIAISKGGEWVAPASQ